jgi:hypothetical protein
MNDRILRIGLTIALGLAVPTVALAAGPNANADKGQGVAKEHKGQHGKPTNPGNSGGHGKSGDHGKPADPGNGNGNDVDNEGDGNRPHNHGWYVSQAAHADYDSGAEHGEAVSEVAQSDIGK